MLIILDMDSSTVHEIKAFNDFVAEFTRTCRKRFNMKVEVVPERLQSIDPELLLTVAGELLAEKGYAFPEGLKVKRRIRDIVYLRHAFCKMCFDNGLAKNRIKNYLELDRCTIIHSIKSANMLLDTKDKEFIKTYYNLLNSYADKQKDRDIADGIYVDDNDVFMCEHTTKETMVLPTQQTL
jgi:hypothetical protein